MIMNKNTIFTNNIKIQSSKIKNKKQKKTEMKERDLNHLLMNAEVRIRLKVGDIEVGARRSVGFWFGGSSGVVGVA